MKIYLGYNTFGFIGIYPSIDANKSFTREFVDVVICNGKENSCDLVAKKAGYDFNTYIQKLMIELGWTRVREGDYYNYDEGFYCYERTNN